MIVVFGSLNLDQIAWVEDLPRPGQTVLAQTFRTEPGGKGGNQALAATRDGASVRMIGSVGSDVFADRVLSELRSAGVNVDGVVARSGASGCALISADRQGCNCIVVYPGANALSQAADVPDSVLRPDTVLLLQMEVPADESTALIERARARGCRIVLNLAPALTMPEDALRALDWLVLNEEEAEFLASTASIAATAAGLHQWLGIGVIRTRGSGGVEAAWSDADLCLPAHAVEVVDSTAAGDCFTGVFAAALDRGLAPAAALTRANAAGALACTQMGSQGSLPPAAAIDALLAGKGAPAGKTD